jgi:beta-xylosidase
MKNEKIEITNALLALDNAYFILSILHKKMLDCDEHEWAEEITDALNYLEMADNYLRKVVADES